MAASLAAIGSAHAGVSKSICRSGSSDNVLGLMNIASADPAGQCLARATAPAGPDAATFTAKSSTAKSSHGVCDAEVPHHVPRREGDAADCRSARPDDVGLHGLGWRSGRPYGRSWLTA